LEEAAMTRNWQQELESAIHSGIPMEEIVALLRGLKGMGVTQDEVYAMLDTLHATAADTLADDRILEVADFVAGFCSPHMKVW
jgi:hypothetical protein